MVFLDSFDAFAEPLVRYFLGIFFLMIGVQFASRSLGLHARMGFSFINYGRRASAGWWHRHVFNVFRALILLAVVARIFVDIDPWLGVLDSLYYGPVLVTGMLLLLVSFSLVNYLQAYMHDDWRTGVDPNQNRHLLTGGPFSRSRNPVFMAIMLGQFGFFLALPSVFSLVCLIAGVTVLLRQARVEEKALADIFGDAYEAYRRRVPRWL
ncbi:isoprenylcysteine carboxylmethyltransferase family protein [Marinobacter vulgaris]|uniref:Isoprenylcysteine carboxylmethyltransferase family protein n=1 Tax=Marinobacter vulgaris TaxID=1928331 RepID=A0A2V3ZJQ8_9GAMM|nr:isoprenylcysteine carboxylmethyltransferase family protein [Marinobacter vulgaris]PXX90399.1 isoprenylcysteine carboxylmethyltransferase family protein [Marinobacter vulgaris]TSJ69575.1 isoprenylcysteine carboxylmethyltransferase family protein [Marinobacter vulgaris]